MDITEFVAAVEAKTGRKAKHKGIGQYETTCPAHDDRHASFHFRTGDKGIVAHCKAGCSWESIKAALGLNGMFHVEHKEPEKPLKATGTLEDALAGKTPAGIWKYKNAHGFEIAAAVRYERPDGTKSYSQYSKTERGWINKGLDGLKPIYRLPEISASKAALICVFEGEKCVDAGLSMGFESTTSMGGANAADKTDWSPLAGMEVVIIKDHDDAGTKYAADVCRALAVLRPTPKVRILDLPELEDKEDIVDYIDICRNQEKPWSDDEIAGNISALIAAQPYRLLKPPDDYTPRPVHIRDIIAEPEPNWVWKKYAARGAISLLNGFWKSGKTTLMSLLLKAMAEGGEMISEIAPGRVLVVTEETGNIWVGRNNKLSLGDHIDIEFARWMRKPTLEQWIEYVGKIHTLCEQQKYDLVIFDPFLRISCCRDENSPLDTSEALAPLVQFKDSNAAVLLVHHSKKGNDVSVEQLARGSGEIQAFVEIIINFKRKSDNLKDRRRLISLMSRFDTPQEEIQVTLAEDGLSYSMDGTPFEADRDDDASRIYELLPSAPDKITLADIMDRWKWGKCPAKSNLRRAMSVLKDKKVIRWEEPIKRNQGELYWRKHQD